MKLIRFFLSIFVFAAFLTAGLPVSAMEDEAQSAAMLVVNQAAKNDSRVEILKDFLASHNSPLTAEAPHFVSEADKLNLDWKLVAAIAGVESTFGKHIPQNSYNGWGWGVYTGQNDGVHFVSWQDGITRVSEGLRQNYLDKGATTLEKIGRRYAASPSWSWKVKFFLDKIENFRPANPDQLDISI